MTSESTAAAGGEAGFVSTGNSEHDMEAVLTGLVTKILHAGAILGFVALMGSLLRSIEHGWQPIMFFHIAIYLAVLGVIVFRRFLAFPILAAFLLFVFFSLGLFGCAVYGLGGMGVLILAAFSMLATIMLGTRRGLVAVVLSLGVIALCGLGISTGSITYGFDLAEYVVSPTTWILAFTTFLFLVMTVVISQGSVRDHLERAIRLLHEQNTKLKKTNSVLEDTIRDRDRAMEALQEAEEKWRSITENSPDLIMTLDPQGIIRFINRTLQLPKEEVIGTPIFNYLAEESRPIMRECLERVLRKGQPDACETEHIGSPRRFENRVGPVLRSGRIVALTASSTDITDRKLAQEALRESEHRYAKAEKIAQLGHWVGDLIANEAVWSKELYRIFGIDPAQGTPTYEAFLEFVHPDDRQGLKGKIEASISRVGPLDLELRIMRPNGEERSIHALTEVVLDKRGQPTRSFGVVQDITERKRMEREIQEKRRIEALGTLAGGIAHDFNNILTAVMTNISMARMCGDLEDEISQMLKDAEAASERARGLSHQLLTFAKGGLPIKKVASISTIVKDTARFALSGSNVRCEYVMPADLWSVEVDEGQIGQVIHNLIINADQAMPEGGVIRICAENMMLEGHELRSGKTGRHVRISVEDQGCGIPERQLRKIFDPFFTTKEKGRGLGLTTAFSVIKRHDGQISVESDVGVGTTFHVYLPASEEASPVAERAKEESARGQGRILLIDDEEIIRNSTGKGLRQLGYEVEVARDGAEGITLYERAMKGKQPFDAVIMDLTIPGGMGGRKAIRELVKIDPEANVIVSSGYSEDPIMSDYSAHGFRGVVAKPYRIEDLGRVLRETITAKKG